jgi:hypothetical protein
MKKDLSPGIIARQQVAGSGSGITMLGCPIFNFERYPYRVSQVLHYDLSLHIILLVGYATK